MPLSSSHRARRFASAWLRCPSSNGSGGSSRAGARRDHERLGVRDHPVVLGLGEPSLSDQHVVAAVRPRRLGHAAAEDLELVVEDPLPVRDPVSGRGVEPDVLGTLRPEPAPAHLVVAHLERRAVDAEERTVGLRVEGPPVVPSLRDLWVAGEHDAEPGGRESLGRLVGERGGGGHRRDRERAVVAPDADAGDLDLLPDGQTVLLVGSDRDRRAGLRGSGRRDVCGLAAVGAVIVYRPGDPLLDRCEGRLVRVEARRVPVQEQVVLQAGVVWLGEPVDQRRVHVAVHREHDRREPLELQRVLARISGCDWTSRSRFMSKPLPFARVPRKRPSGFWLGIRIRIA